jgi:hypothetical protein
MGSSSSVSTRRSSRSSTTSTRFAEGGAVAALAQANDDALEHLDAFLVAFDNLGMHAHGIAAAEIWYIARGNTRQRVKFIRHGVILNW